MAIAVASSVYRCTGNSAAETHPCSFTTRDPDAAFAHFESYDHDVTLDESSPWATPPVECLPTKLYLEIPLTFDQCFEDLLGDVRIDITHDGHEALVEALGGECPCCNRAMAEGEMH